MCTRQRDRASNENGNEYILPKIACQTYIRTYVSLWLTDTADEKHSKLNSIKCLTFKSIDLYIEERHRIWRHDWDHTPTLARNVRTCMHVYYYWLSEMCAVRRLSTIRFGFMLLQTFADAVHAVPCSINCVFCSASCFKTNRIRLYVH